MILLTNTSKIFNLVSYAEKSEKIIRNNSVDYKLVYDLTSPKLNLQIVVRNLQLRI